MKKTSAIKVLKILLGIYQAIIVVLSTIYVVMTLPYVFESGTDIFTSFTRVIAFLVVLILGPTIVFCSFNVTKLLLPAHKIFSKWKSLTQISIVFTVLWTLLPVYWLILQTGRRHCQTSALSSAAKTRQFYSGHHQTSVAKTRPRAAPNVNRLQIGQIAPDFSVKDQFGQTISLSGLRGKIVLLDFWGVWCGPCRKKLPQTQKIYDQFKNQGLVVIGVHSAFQTEKTASFLAENNYTFPTGIDTGDIANNYAVNGWPTYYLIDKKGRLAWGPEPKPPSEEQIESLLKD